MSILVKPEQVRGGILKANATVGIVLSIKLKDSPPINVPGVGQLTLDGDFLTKQILDKVLVTRVQGATVPASDASGANPLPASSVMLTVALNTSDVEKLTWAQNEGVLIISVENKDTDDSSSQYTVGKVVLK
jgi:hypothetical protein